MMSFTTEGEWGAVLGQHFSPGGQLAIVGSMGAVWLTLGIIGQAAVAAALVACWTASQRAGRPIAPVGWVCVGIAGVLLAGAYAVARREWVFAVGQLLVAMIGVILVSYSATNASPQPSENADRPRLPEVKPDSAEINLSMPESRRDSER